MTFPVVLERGEFHKAIETVRQLHRDSLLHWNMIPTIPPIAKHPRSLFTIQKLSSDFRGTKIHL